MEIYENEKTLRTDIMYQECNMFLIGSNNNRRRDFLRRTVHSFPYNRKGKPIGVYVDAIGLPIVDKARRKVNKEVIDGITGSFLHSSIAKRTLEVINRAPVRNFSRRNEVKLIETLKGKGFIGEGVEARNVKEAIDYYRSNMDSSRRLYESYLHGERIEQFGDVLITGIDLNNFYDTITESLNLDSHFSVVLDRRSPISSHSTTAVNSLVSSTCSSFSIKVATSLTGWKHFNHPDGYLEDGKDYITLLLDDSAPNYLEKKRK